MQFNHFAKHIQVIHGHGIDITYNNIRCLKIYLKISFCLNLSFLSASSLLCCKKHSQYTVVIINIQQGFPETPATMENRRLFDMGTPTTGKIYIHFWGSAWQGNSLLLATLNFSLTTKFSGDPACIKVQIICLVIDASL